MLHPMLHPLDLGHRGTPLQRLDRPSERLGIDIWVKRDDLTGLGLSGNKVRKLAFLLAEAHQQGCTTVITCGGIQSNHCRATAVAARQLGMRPVLLLRGQPPGPGGLDGNLLLDAILGAEIRWTDPAGYQHRDARMAAIAEELRARGERPYVVPEGGSNALGALGFVEAGQELISQARQRGLEFDRVMCAVGSGGTLAGLALAGLPWPVSGVAVCDDQAYFRQRVREIGSGAVSFGLSLPEPGDSTWDVLEGFQGRGYALSTPDELRLQLRLSRETGLFLDPVYTGKAWVALETLAARGELGRRVLFWHTGGIYGLFGRGSEYDEALADGRASG